MKRTVLAVLGTAALAGAGVLATSTAAVAYDLTKMTAVVTPDTVAPGETVTVTLTVVNLHDRKVTYDPIVAPDDFADCAVQIPTLKPGGSETVQCSAVITKKSDLNPRFSIRSAASEHNKTKAHASVTITLKPDKESPSPEEPTTSEPQSEPEPEPEPEQPALPVTGSSVGPLAAVGGVLLLLGGLLGFWRWRTSRT